MKNILLSWRHIKNDKSNSIINIVGLGIALGVFAVAMVFVSHEYNYNRCFKDSNRIYRVNVYDSMFNQINNSVPYVLSKTLVADYPQVEDACALTGNYYKVTVERTGYEIPVSGVTPNFFDMFGIEVIEGDVYNLDNIEKSIVLNQSQARNIFGKEHCVGETLPVKWSVDSIDFSQGRFNSITIERTAELTVVAVVDDYPQNATFKPTAFLSTSFWIAHRYTKGHLTVKERMEEMDMSNPMSSVYVKMAKHTDLKGFESKMNDDVKRIHKEKLSRYNFVYQPITDIYFDKHFGYEDHKNNGNRLLCKTTFFIGLLILLIAFFNYVNLASATADRRLRTQAICQINGARTGNIVWQSIEESLMLIVLSLPLSVLVTIYGLPKISTLFEIDASLSFVGSFASLVVVWAVTAILFGLFSGFAIKFRLRRISLADAVKSSVIKTGDRLIFTNILTIIQIAIFCGLFTSILLMDRQIKYALKADFGFDKDGLLVVKIDESKYSTFKDEAGKLPGIIGIAGTSEVPMEKLEMGMGYFNDSTQEYISIRCSNVDEDFFKVIGANIIEGNDFEKGMPSVIINKKAQQVPQLKLGEQTPFGVVQGVVKDFNFGNAHSEIEPIIYQYYVPGVSQNEMVMLGDFKNVLIRINLMQTPNIISDIEKVWKKTFPDTDFNWYFVDEKVAESYKKDRNYSFVISALTIIALFIAIIGIIGLSASLNQKRVKEIGIRKVNGATSAEILQMLCRRYIWIVAVAIAVSVPCAYSFVAYWLKDFAYKIGITPEPFIISAIATLLIVLATVAIQSLSVARRNPVEAIKTE